MSLESCVVKVSVGAVMTAENTSRSACFATGALGSVVGAIRRKVSNTAWGTSVANSGTLLRYVTMRVSGRKPQSAVKDVIASAISGLWFGSAMLGFGLIPARQRERVYLCKCLAAAHAVSLLLPYQGDFVC
jgi:hypothetical protein